jgi:hypothetical protein
MTALEYQIEFESEAARERIADLAVIQKIDRGLHGINETAYIMEKFEELRRLKYGIGAN